MKRKLTVLSYCIPSLRFTILLLGLTYSQVAFGQFAENIRSGRPGQSIGAYTLGAKVFQIQSGVNYNVVNLDANNKTNRWLHNTVLRLGLLEKWEISALINLQTDEVKVPIEKRQTGWSETQIGARYNIIADRERGPTLGVQARALLPWQSEAYRREKIGTTVIAMSSQKINDRLMLLANVGMTWQGNGGAPKSFYSLSLNTNWSEQWSSFVEIYGRIDEISISVDGGLAYLVNSDLQLDLSAGWQGDDDIRDWFVDAGISWRIVWRE
ncbi:MAG: transporter [Bacteroidota bacterium]